MPTTDVLTERIAVFDRAIECTEQVLSDRRVQEALGGLAMHLLDRVQTAYLPNVSDYGVVSMPKNHVDTDHVAVLPVMPEGGSQFLNPDWFMPPARSIAATIPQLRNVWPEKCDEALHEVVLSRSLGEYGGADFLTTDILTLFEDGDDLGMIGGLFQVNVDSLWEDHKIAIKTPPIIFLGDTSLEGCGYGLATTLVHEFSHVVQADYIDNQAGLLPGELFAYRTGAAVLTIFSEEIDPETLEVHKFSLEVEQMRARVNTPENPYAEHSELVQFFAERAPEYYEFRESTN